MEPEEVENLSKIEKRKNKQVIYWSRYYAKNKDSVEWKERRKQGALKNKRRQNERIVELEAEIRKLKLRDLEV